MNLMENQKIEDTQPFVKWVGGKRGLLSQIELFIHKDFNNYFEPFVGGGALFFHLYNLGYLKNKKAYLFDINSELINTYNVVKNNPQELIKNLKIFKEKHSKEFYYEIRAWDRENDFLNKSDIERATRFIYLNKTCFNGLYRVNKKNQNNVPMGNYKNPNICDEKTILNASKALQNAIILNTSYKNVLDYAKKNDFVYFDPPYYPLTETSSFTSYSEFDFLKEEQAELFHVFQTLTKKGCYVLHSNSDTSYIKNLYKSFQIIDIQANRFINSKSDKRGKINEILVRGDIKMKIEDKNYFKLELDEKKELFSNNLVSTNRGFNFYVDWENASGYKDFEIELNALNVLIRLNDKNLEKKFIELLQKLPSVIKTFPLLFALSKKERENIWKEKETLHILEDVDLNKNALKYSFSYIGNLSNVEIKEYYTLFSKLGLKYLFQNLLEKNVIDYVIGVLVGLDSNGRKNRGGKSFELACEPIIEFICNKYNITLHTQKQFKFLEKDYSFKIDENIANRKADFILVKGDKAVNIEANFYFDSGSKPEEIIDSYTNRQNELRQNNIDFIYLTDGIKCWGNVDKNQLTKGFRSIDYIINFHMLKEKFFEDIIKEIFRIS